LVSIAAANRDDAIFDDPEQLDLERTANAHMGFGHGPHHCLGAQLARMELQVALTTLLARLPDVRLAVPEEEVPWKSGLLVRGPLSLVIEWGDR
jgi:cytochrome P450